LRGSFDPSQVKGQTSLGIAPTAEPFRRAYEGDGHSHILIWNAGSDLEGTHNIPSQQSPFAAWKPKGVTVHGVAGTAPDGSNTATKLVEDVNTGSREITANLILDDLTKPVFAHVYAHAG